MAVKTVRKKTGDPGTLDLFSEAGGAASTTGAQASGVKGKSVSGKGKDEKKPVPAKKRGKPGSKKSAGSNGAEQMARNQREISISEFFTKNRHLLGFDNPSKALLTTIKEAVDNSLDACEEGGILPDIYVEVTGLAEDRFRVLVRDNGPGIVRAQVPKIFGKLLYGSKFHSLKQSRGQQGIGISAAGMYGQLTTGRPVMIHSRPGARAQANYYELKINTKKNEPNITKDQVVDWDYGHGTQVEIELEASYKRGRRSIDDYLELTAIANPHLELTYMNPAGDEIQYPRVSDELPVEPKAIRPHPYGVELGALLAMAHESKSRNMQGFLTSEFSRVGSKVAEEILEKAMLPAKTKPKRLSRDEAELLVRAISQTKIMNPPTNCLSPIGDEELEAGLRKVVDADFFATVSRRPSVYRGNPFLVEVALAWGVDGMNNDDLAVLHRFANRVPLQYQQGACAITKSVVGTSWKKYGVNQSRGAMPGGPLVILVHVASSWVPFTSESKEAIASYPEILKEIKLGIMECSRQLGVHIRRGVRARDEEKKRDYIKSYIPAIGEALREILGLSEAKEKKVVATLTDTLERSRKY